jgi:hypothetical protein
MIARDTFTYDFAVYVSALYFRSALERPLVEEGFGTN